MRTLVNVLAGLLGVVALLMLPLPIATAARLWHGDSSLAMLLFTVPALLLSMIGGWIVVRYFRRRDAASAGSVVTLSCFVLWLFLNAGSRKLPATTEPISWWSPLLHLIGPILVAVLLNRLLQTRVARAFTPSATS